MNGEPVTKGLAPGPLRPYRVLDLTDGDAQLAGYALAQLGAEVILVEPSAGSRTRRCHRVGPGGFSFSAYNRGKRSIAVDLDNPADHERFRRLVSTADVLLDSATPGEMATLGFGPDQLAALNPALVHASITPYGSTGPRATWHASDLCIMAAASPLSHTGDRDRPPLRLSAPQGFRFGAAATPGAVVLGLLDRARTGRGQWIDVSATEVAALATQAGLLAAGANAPVPQRSAGGAQVGPLSLQFVYPAADGHVSITHVFGPAIGPATAALIEWAHEEGHCSAELAAKDWIDFAIHVDQGIESVETFEESKQAITALTSSKTKAELLAGARERRLLMAPIATTLDVMTDDHLAARGYYDEMIIPAEDGTLRTVRAPGVFAQASATPLVRLGAAPGLDEMHDADVSGTPSPGPSWGDPAADGVLAGLKVLDFTWSIAGPHVTRVLADHGATVVKVESETKMDAARGFMPIHDNEPGAEQSVLFDDMNAGKLSITLDMSRPEARDVARDLVKWADVVIESFSPRAMPAWEMSYEDLRRINPSLIMLSTCLTGQTGPLAGFAGYGNLGAALAGFYGLGGWPDRPPAGPFGAYTDYTSTHFQLAALLAALDHRRRTGEGQYLDVSQAEAAMMFLAPELLAASVTGSASEPMGNDDPVMAPHGVFPAGGDDQWVAIVCQNDEAWPALAELIGRTDLADDAALVSAEERRQRSDELADAISTWSRGLDAEAAAVACQEAGVAAYRVQNSAECLADPQLAARGHFVDLDHPRRRCLVEAGRFRLSASPGRPRRRPPELGEHTFEVLTEILGYDGDRIAELAASEVLG